MYRTVLHTDYSRTRLLKKSSPARNQKSSISEYLVVQCTYTFQKKRGLNYILQERRVYLWDTLKAIRLTEYTSQDSRRFTSVGMKHLMKTQLTTNPERNLLKKQKHPEFMIQP